MPQIFFIMTLGQAIRKIPVDIIGTLLIKSTQVVDYLIALLLNAKKKTFLILDDLPRETGLWINE